MHLTVTTTSRTHCHFVMQARALRVPEVCVYHTPPLCLVAFPFTMRKYWFFYTLVLPDPWLTQEGPVTSLVNALYQLFVMSCDLAHDGQHCSHFCANTHRSLLLHLSLVLAFVYICSQMDEHQNVRPSSGTTEWNHSYYNGNSLSALHSSQQIHDDTVSTSVLPRRLTALRPQALRSVHSYHPAPSAHLFLRAPLATSQAKQCQLRLPRPSRSSHFLSSYSAATSELLLFSRLSYQSPFHSWILLCRRLHPLMPLRMRPRRRLISLSPRYLLTWQCRRLSTVSTPHLWMLLCRRSHTVLFLRTFLRRWVPAKLPRFLLT